MGSGGLNFWDDFNNTGTVTVSGNGWFNVTAGITTNNGTINIEDGAINVTGGGINNGTIYVDLDEYIVLGNTWNLSNGSGITGRGSVYLNTGETSFDVNNVTLQRLRYPCGTANPLFNSVMPILYVPD